MVSHHHNIHATIAPMGATCQTGHTVAYRIHNPGKSTDDFSSMALLKLVLRLSPTRVGGVFSNSILPLNSGESPACVCMRVRRLLGIEFRFSYSPDKQFTY